MYYNIKESGLRIQKLRKQSGLTQQQLADKLNISVSNIGKIETGRNGFSIDLMIEMAFCFNVSLDYIVLGREMQTDTIKKQIRSMMEQLAEMEKQL